MQTDSYLRDDCNKNKNSVDMIEALKARLNEGAGRYARSNACKPPCLLPLSRRPRSPRFGYAASRYTLEYRLDDEHSFDSWTRVETSGSFETVTGLTPGNGYVFRVRTTSGILSDNLLAFTEGELYQWGMGNEACIARGRYLPYGSCRKARKCVTLSGKMRRQRA